MDIKQHRNEITAFIIDSKIYRVIGTSHGMKQMDSRKLDPYHIASACLAMGKRLETYNNSGNHIMLVDEGKNLATVITVENYTIVLITVIDKSNVYIKPNTVLEDCSFKELA